MKALNKHNSNPAVRNEKYFFKNECEGFIRFPNTRKHLKPRGRRPPEWYYCFRAFGNLMKPEARVFEKAVEQKKPKKSALAEHCLQSGHTISWESSTILRASSSWRTRRLLEAWEINTCKNPLNRDDGMFLPQDRSTGP